MPVSLHTTSAVREVDAHSASPRLHHITVPRGRHRSEHAALAVLPTGHKRTDAALDGGLLGPIPRNSHRRLNRSEECSGKAIAAAIPPGSVRAAHGAQVAAHLLRILDNKEMRADGRRNRIQAMAYLIARATYTTMTCRPGWDAIADTVGCHRRTIARYLAEFEEWGLLGRVAGGRSARYAAVGPDGKKINEAAVYVLCIPSPLALVRAISKRPVDLNATPPALSGSQVKKEKLTPTRARGKGTNIDVAPPRSPSPGAAGAASQAQVPWRPELRWPAHRTTSRKLQRLAAASEIRYQSFPLRAMSIRDVASCCRDFLLAGWTVSDVMHAIDHKPDGTVWPHSGAPDTKDAWRMRGWLGHRLAVWRTSTGEPLRSRDQRIAAAAEAARREKEAFRRQILTRQAEHAARLSEGDSPAKVKALAQIRAILNSTPRMDSGISFR